MQKSFLSPAASTKVSSPNSAKSASPASQYERIESNIGEGTYGKVHKARDVRTGQIVAIKKSKVSAENLVEVGGISFMVLREIKLMQAVRHQNVMSCLDVFADGGVLHLVMEFMDGDLKKVIENKEIKLTETHVKCLSSQLLKGLAALHSLSFLHRDVKPANVLLNYTSGIANLTDFGTARTISHKRRPLTPRCTTECYRAPELFYGAKFYGPSVDVWSAACVIAELFLRFPLFPAEGEFRMLAKIFERRGTPTPESWPEVSELPNYVEFSFLPEVPFSTLLPFASASSQCLLQKLLSLNPRHRPDCEDALRHEFFLLALPVPCDPHELPFLWRNHEVSPVSTKPAVMPEFMS
jgi:cyclin-dependent kinase 7